LLPRAARITEDREFKAVFSRGRSYRGDLIVMYVLSRRGKALRFGFTTVRKIAKSVRRNRVKRLMRESVRRLLPQIRGGADIILLARSRAEGASFAEIDAEVRRLLGASGLLREAESC